jgi:hypothetical protein
MEYTVLPARTPPALTGQAAGKGWSRAGELRVARFHAQSSRHRPETRVRMLYDAAGLYLRFRVRDRYVRCTHTRYQSKVCCDSCVEFFVQPRDGAGYLNFEFNAGGAMLVYYIEDPERTATGFRRYTKLPRDVGGLVEICHSLPSLVEPELRKPVEWRLDVHIPFRVIEACIGHLGDVAGQVWRANFYKCGDQTSHPHWASWAPLRNGRLDFHQPQFFGTLRFE